MAQDYTPVPGGMTPQMVAVSKELRTIAAQVDSMLKEAAGEGTLFALTVFTKGRFQYVSNARREDVAEALRGLLVEWEAQAKPPESSDKLS